jgi:hypothetical protein
MANIDLLAFAGLTTVSGGSISVIKIQQLLLKNSHDLLARFTHYEDYFALSTGIAVVGGVLFALYPITLTAWLGRVFVGMSLLYLILGAAGVLQWSPIAFYVVYFAVALVAAATQLPVATWYFRRTKLDGYVLAALALGTLVWAGCELWAFYGRA